MKLLLKYPTRQRPLWFKKTLETYYSMISGKHPYEFFITLDEDDGTMNNREMRAYLDKLVNLKYRFGRHKGKIDAINADMEGLEWDVLLLVSDDMIPVMKGYDDIIIQMFEQFFPTTDGALHFNDGLFGKNRTITLSIMGRKLYQRFGYIYHPSYKSFFCDDEFTDEVYKLGKVKYFPQVIIKHDWKGGPLQEVLYKRNNALGAEDKATYKRRKSMGFPKE